MNSAVFAGRPDVMITVGEMPGVTVADAALFTDPARREVDMVFQFEHVSLDSGPGGKWDIRPLQLLDLKASLGRWQAGLADIRLEQPVLGQSRSAAGGIPIRRRRRIPGAIGETAGDRAAPASRNALRLPGRRTRDDECPVRRSRRFPGHRIGQPFRRARRPRGEDPEPVLAALRLRSRDNARTPMQWDATAAAGFTTGQPWIAVNPNYRRDQRRRAGR